MATPNSHVIVACWTIHRRFRTESHIRGGTGSKRRPNDGMNTALYFLIGEHFNRASGEGGCSHESLTKGMISPEILRPQENTQLRMFYSCCLFFKYKAGGSILNTANSLTECKHLAIHYRA